MSGKSEVTPEQTANLIRSYYADQVLKKMEAVSGAHKEALEAFRNLTEFNRTGKLPDGRDALLVAAWSGSRVIRADADEIRGGGSTWERGDRARDERLAVLRWLDKNGYDIGAVFAADLKEESG